MANSTTVFGTELRRLRRAAGISLADLAARVHYSKGYLSRVETGCQSASHAMAQQCDTALMALVPQDCRRRRGSAGEVGGVWARPRSLFGLAIGWPTDSRMGSSMSILVDSTLASLL